MQRVKINRHLFCTNNILNTLLHRVTGTYDTMLWPVTHPHVPRRPFMSWKVASSFSAGNNIWKTSQRDNILYAFRPTTKMDWYSIWPFPIRLWPWPRQNFQNDLLSTYKSFVASWQEEHDAGKFKCQLPFLSQKLWRKYFFFRKNGYLELSSEFRSL